MTAIAVRSRLRSQRRRRRPGRSQDVFGAGVYGASVITALTAQNTRGVQGIHDVPPAFIARQIDSVFSDLAVGAVKIGMLSRPAAIEAVADGLARYGIETVVLDPVMVATSGDRLLARGGRDAAPRPHPEGAGRDAQPAGSRRAPRRAGRGGRGGDAGPSRAHPGPRPRRRPGQGRTCGGRRERGHPDRRRLDACSASRRPASRPATRTVRAARSLPPIAAGLAKGSCAAEAVAAAKLYVSARDRERPAAAVGRGTGPVAPLPRALASSWLAAPAGMRRGLIRPEASVTVPWRDRADVDGRNGTGWASKDGTGIGSWTPARRSSPASSARPSSGCARPTICPFRNSPSSRASRNRSSARSSATRRTRRWPRSGGCRRRSTSRSSACSPTGDEEPFIEKSIAGRHADPGLRRRQGAARHHRLDQDGRMAAMVRRLCRARRRAGFRSATSAAPSSAFGARRRVRGRGRRRRAARQGRRDAALPLRPAAHRPLRRRRAGPRHDGLHPQGGGDGLARRRSACGAFAAP